MIAVAIAVSATIASVSTTIAGGGDVLPLLPRPAEQSSHQCPCVWWIVAAVLFGALS